jgi:iron-sulfur cluster insertion protein
LSFAYSGRSADFHTIRNSRGSPIIGVLAFQERRMSAVADNIISSPEADAPPPPLVFTDSAANKVKELVDEEGNPDLKLRVFVQGGGCSGFQYGLMIEENGVGSGDQVYESHGVKLFVDPISIRYLKGAEVDFVDTVTGGGFTIKNPNATSTCGCGSSFTTE